MKQAKPAKPYLPLDQNPAFQSWFKGSKVVDAQGNPLRVFRGDFRADQIGHTFKPSRNTSGRFFFTESPEVASGYAQGKQDTQHSEKNANVESWFRFPSLKGSREKNAPDLRRAWYLLSAQQRERVKQVALSTSWDEEDDSKFAFDAEPINSVENITYEARKEGGNWLLALAETWLTSGALYGEERRFCEILAHAGLDVEYDHPDEPRSIVTPVYLRIRNPLDTSALPGNVIERLRNLAKSDRSRAKAQGVDNWDKSTITPKSWMETLETDLVDGTTYAWTTMPEKVTELIESLGYDGIKDTGGKNLGGAHTVWIAFYPTQIKSALGNSGNFDPDKGSILASGKNVTQHSRQTREMQAGIAARTKEASMQGGTYYHGGPEITNDRLRTGQSGAIFFTKSRAYAESYMKARDGMPGVLYEVDLDFNDYRIFDPESKSDLAQLQKGYLRLVEEGEYESKADALSDYRQVIERDLLDWAEASQFLDVIEAAGFHGARMRERPGTIRRIEDGSYEISGDPIESVALFDGEIPVRRSAGVVKSAGNRHKSGIVMADVPESEALEALVEVADRIEDQDLAGQGLDFGTAHITIRWGLSGPLDPAVAYLRNQPSFEVELSATNGFEPSDSSDGAAVLIAPVSAPELFRMNAELAENADFAEATFEYRPHVTIAYLRPEAIGKYLHDETPAGKRFRVSEVVVRSAEGENVLVTLGKVPEQHSSSKQAGAKDVSAIIDEYMPLVAKGLPKPSYRIWNQTRASWLGRYTWGDERLNLFTINLQKSIVGHETTLRRVIAHELCHHEDVIVNWSKLTDSEKKEFDPHGPSWKAIAARFNSALGPDFVVPFSDKSDVIDSNRYWLLVIPNPDLRSGDLLYTIAVRPSAQQKRRVEQLLSLDVGAKLFQTSERDFLPGGVKLGGPTWSIPRGRLQEKLRTLYESGEQQKLATLDDKQAGAEAIPAIVTQFMPLLAPGLPEPVVRVVNHTGSPWLGRDNWKPSNPDTTLIEIQRSIVADDHTLRSVLAHEMCHHEDVLLNWAPLSLSEKRLAKNLDFTGGHGPSWQAIADRFNARFGDGFVNATSDQSHVVEDIDNLYYLLVRPSYGRESDKLIYATAVRPSPKQKVRIDQEITDHGARLFRVSDLAFVRGPKISTGFAIPSGEKQEKLRSIFEGHDQVKIASIISEEERLSARPDYGDKRSARRQYAPPPVPRDPQTETPEFKAWFKNSKAVDLDGVPLVVYHGSPDMRWLKESGGEFQSRKERYDNALTLEEQVKRDVEKAFWFAGDLSVASSYAHDKPAFDYQNAEAGVFEAYLSLQNPLVINNQGQRWTHQTYDTILKAKEDGHDGLVIKNTIDDYSVKGKKLTTTYAVFSADQIKAVKGNSGGFDPGSKSVFAGKRKVGFQIVFDPNDRKAARNLQKHGISFQEAQTVFDDPHLVILRDEDHSLDEDHFAAIGYSARHRILYVVYVVRNPAIPGDQDASSEVFRIISARPATSSEAKLYAN